MRWIPVLLFAALAAAEPLAPRVERLAAPLVEAGTVNGMVVGVFDGEQEVVLGFGEPRPDGDTVYEIGSVTKVFTGVLLAALVQDGTVRLDQPVAELLPPEVEMPAHGETRITLADLATHGSGLPRMPDNFEPADPGNPYADYTAERLYAFLEGCRLARAPRAEYEYSNLGAGLLGHALARKAGKDYEELLKERVTGPLGMASTAVTLTPDLKKRLAPGHDHSGRPVANWDLAALAGAGAIRSTARDMLRFLRANLAEDGGGAALGLAREVHFTPPQGMRMGLGWHISPDGVHWHNGQTGGYHAFAAVDTGRGHAVVVLCNTGTGAVDELGSQLLRTLRGEKVEPKKPRRAVAVDPEVLKDYVGTYRLLPTFRLMVTLEDGRLMVQATGQEKFQVFPESETKFFYRVVDAQLTFEREEDGKVARLILHQNGRDMPGPRE